MSRILYFCPDFPQPSGGVKTLYRHVHRLCAQGLDATIVHQQRDFSLSWHGYKVPVTWLEDRPRFDPDDVWVLPEVMVDLARKVSSFPGRRVVIALSWAPTYNRLRPGERWQDLGIQHVMVKSPVIKDYLEWAMQIDVTLIPEWVNPALYRHEPTQKQQKIAYTTRKDQAGELLRGILTRRGAPFTEFSWMPLRELDEATYARHLRESSLFLATTVQEGMHVSVLEAMACGCLVVGFTGIGGGVYMAGDGAAQNCLLVENGNLPAMGKLLEQIVHDLVADPKRYAAVTANAIRAAGVYQDEEAETRALMEFFTMICQTSSPA